MRIVLLFWILARALAGQQTVIQTLTSPQNTTSAVPANSQEPGTIEGQIFNLSTGEPVKKANLVMRRTGARSGNMGAMPSSSYSTTTDAGGRFAMQDLEPGNYLLSAERTGFVSSQYGARGPGRPGVTLSLGPGQHLKDVVFRLTPQAVITGRVLDQDGDPVAHAHVQTMRYRYLQGRKQLSPFGNASTDDLGEYRIFGLAPGRYYLSATARGEMMMEPTVDRSANAAPEEGYVPTYYPGSTDPASAAPVEALAGAQLRGMDFTLSKTRTVRIRGRVMNSAGFGRNRVQIMLMPRDGMGFFGGNRASAMDAEGRFEIRGVAPGGYNLTAWVFDGKTNLSGSEPVDVGSSNLENISLTIQPGMELAGQVRTEGQTKPSLSGLTVNLRPREQRTFGAPGAPVKEDGSFTLSSVSAGNYDLMLNGLGDGYYVKSVLLADKDVRETGMNLTKGAAGPVTVVISPNAGQVEGVVLNAKQQPAQGATVVLVPKDEKRRERPQSYKTVTTDQYGRYSLKTVEPGDYRLFAWDDIEYGAYMDPEFLKPVEDRGLSVSVRENSHENQQLTVIASEDAQAAAQSRQAANP